MMNQNVRIELKGANEQSSEYKAAKSLKDSFRRSLPKEATGEILIVPSAIFYGSQVKDVDILIVGQLENCMVDIVLPDSGNQKQTINKQVIVRSFVCAIELKSHTCHGVRRVGTKIYVDYHGHDHCVTDQSEGQKNAILKYLKAIGKDAPYISNLIWFKSMTSSEVDNLLTEREAKLPSNLLPCEFSFSDFIQAISINGCGKSSGDRHYLNSFGYGTSATQEFSAILDFFTKSKMAMGELTRRKIEQLTSDILSESNQNIKFGSDLVVYNGRAGTGKTNKLLKAAYKLAIKDDMRVLILTYNKALASDIRRINTLAGIPDEFDGQSVKVKTIYAFFYHLLRAINLDTELEQDFLVRYEKLLTELYEFLDTGAISKGEIYDTIKLNREELSWDYVLIDEAQDFLEVEKDILFKLFGQERIVIANGIDQRVRNRQYCNWAFGISNKKIEKLKTCLRQKENLVNFVNDFAYRCGMSQFVLIPEKKMVGGRVIITTSDYLSGFLHDREIKLAKEAGNECYDYLFLTPPTLVSKQEGELGFVNINKFKEKGINLWDGTRAELRTDFPVYADQHRLLQYDSCRGLEGWTVVCLEFDQFLNYKERFFTPSAFYEDISLESPEEQKRMFVNEWGLIPLTRAIDTLIITIKDSNHWAVQILRGIYKNSDYIEWIE